MSFVTSPGDIPSKPVSSRLPPDFLNVILRAHDLICETEDEDKPHRGFIGDGKGHIQQALARVDERYYGVERFPTIPEKAAILLKELVEIHPFVDGNKRTALMATAYFLLWNRVPLVNYKTEADLVRRIADKADPNGPTFDDIVEWIRKNTQPFDVASKLEASRFSRYQELDFSFRISRRDHGDRSRLAIDVVAIDPKTQRTVSNAPFLRRVLDFFRPSRPVPHASATGMPPRMTRAEELQRAENRRRNLERKHRKNKGRRRRRR